MYIFVCFIFYLYFLVQKTCTYTGFRSHLVKRLYHTTKIVLGINYPGMYRFMLGVEKCLFGIFFCELDDDVNIFTFVWIVDIRILLYTHKLKINWYFPLIRPPVENTIFQWSQKPNPKGLYFLLTGD